MSPLPLRPRRSRSLAERDVAEELAHVDDVCQDRQMMNHLTKVKEWNRQNHDDIGLLKPIIATLMEGKSSSKDVQRLLKGAALLIKDMDQRNAAIAEELGDAFDTEADDVKRHGDRGQRIEFKRRERTAGQGEGPHAS